MTRLVNRYAANGRAGSEGYAGLLTLLVLFLLTAAGFAWVSMGIVTSERWPIRWLEVNGAFQRVSAEQLRANLTSRVGANFFTVDLQGLQEAALSNGRPENEVDQIGLPTLFRVLAQNLVQEGAKADKHKG